MPFGLGLGLGFNSIEYVVQASSPVPPEPTPLIVSKSPDTGYNGASKWQPTTIVFDQDMDQSTIIAGNLQVFCDGIPLTSDIAFPTTSSITLTPNVDPFTPGGLVEIELYDEIKSSTGIPIEYTFWSYHADTTLAYVTCDKDSAIDVENHPIITVYLLSYTAMNETTVTLDNVNLANILTPEVPIAGILSASQGDGYSIIQFETTGDLEAGESYALTITTGVLNLAEFPVSHNTPNTPEDIVLTFTTELPMIFTNDFPPDTATDVPIVTEIHADAYDSSFLAPIEIDASAASYISVVDEESNPVAGDGYAGGSELLLFIPDVLAYNTTYTVTITTDVISAKGFNLSEQKQWSFTTVAE